MELNSQDFKEVGSNQVPKIQNEDKDDRGVSPIKGKVVASCKRCGNISIDIGRCTECNKILPEGIFVYTFCCLFTFCYLFTFCDLFIFYLFTGTEILPVPDYKPTSEVEKKIKKKKNEVKSISIENEKNAGKEPNFTEGTSEEAIKRREEYDKIAKKLKNSFKKKDKAWLKNLVDDDASLATKRILLSKLMEENHTHISQELATIRFGGKILFQKL